jgi:hypothetical protein
MIEECSSPYSAGSAAAGGGFVSRVPDCTVAGRCSSSRLNKSENLDARICVKRAIAGDRTGECVVRPAPRPQSGNGRISKSDLSLRRRSRVSVIEALNASCRQALDLPADDP